MRRTTLKISDSLRVLIDQIILSGMLVGGAAYFVGSQQAASVAIGSILMTLNLGVLTWTWSRILEKKSIALAGMVIVVKYAFLGAVLYWVTRQSWLHLLWLLVGIVTIIPTALLYALRTKPESKPGIE